MSDLHGQRETIIRSKNRLGGINSDTSRSDRILNVMMVRAKRNKVVTGVVIVLLVIVIILIIAAAAGAF